MSRVIPTAGIALFRNIDKKSTEILLVEHKEKSSHVNGHFGFPAGKIESHETEIEAAIREFEEETGLSVLKQNLVELPKHYIAKIQMKNGSKTFSLKIYICLEFFGEMQSDESVRPKWIKLAKLEEYTLLPDIREIISDCLYYMTMDLRNI